MKKRSRVCSSGLVWHPTVLYGLLLVVCVSLLFPLDPALHSPLHTRYICCAIVGLAVKRSSFLLFQAYCASLPACPLLLPAPGQAQQAARTAALSQLLPRLPGCPLVLPAGRRTSHAGKPVFWPWCLSTCFPHTVAEHSAALTILMGLWRRQWWRRRRPLKAKRSLSIRKPAGVAWQHALLYNSRKLATVAPPLAAHAARRTAAPILPSLGRPWGYWEPLAVLLCSPIGLYWEPTHYGCEWRLRFPLSTFPGWCTSSLCSLQWTKPKVISHSVWVFAVTLAFSLLYLSRYFYNCVLVTKALLCIHTAFFGL